MSKICKNCGAINADHTAYCGKCGKSFSQIKTKSNNKIIPFLVVIVLLLAGFMIWLIGKMSGFSFWGKSNISWSDCAEETVKRNLEERIFFAKKGYLKIDKVEILDNVEGEKNGKQSVNCTAQVTASGSAGEYAGDYILEYINVDGSWVLSNCEVKKDSERYEPDWLLGEWSCTSESWESGYDEVVLWITSVEQKRIKGRYSFSHRSGYQQDEDQGEIDIEMNYKSESCEIEFEIKGEKFEAVYPDGEDEDSGRGDLRYGYGILSTKMEYGGSEEDQLAY